MYLLLPYLREQRYVHFLFFFLLSYLAGTSINYYTAGVFLNSVDYSIPIEPNFQHRMEFGNYNTRWGMIIAIIALGIKLSKDWYLQQKENLEILSKKTKTEMKSQKARIHPDLLFRSLDSIYANIQISSNNSNAQILNLSDLLSYSLYESEMENVPLEKELMEVERLISLENLSNESSIDLRVQLKGDVKASLIAPMIVVKIVEECISCRNTLNPLCKKIKVNITAFHTLSINLSFYKMLDFLSTDSGLLFIENIYKRLDEHYNAEEYQIEFNEVGEEISIKLEIKLKKSGKPETI